MPERAVLVDSREDCGTHTLWPEEREVIASATALRQIQYATVRDCARQALVQLGLPEAAILTDEKRCPIWPEGIVGSMTHCRGYAAAALVRESDLRAIGIDAEPAEPLPEGVLRRVTSEQERNHIENLTHTDPRIPWDRLLFSMKESVYKAWFPLARLPLGFHDVELCIKANQTAEISFLCEVPINLFTQEWHVRWIVDSGVLFTTVYG